MSWRRSTALPLTVTALVVASVLPGDAAPPIERIQAAASVVAPATSTSSAVDVVSVFQTGELTASVRDAALAAAADVGAPAVVGRGFTIGMTRVRRGGAVVQQSSGAGWAFPMAVTALPLEAIGAVMGRRVSGEIALGRIVMGQTTASLRGAVAGDTIDLVAANGAILTFTIGLVATDAEVGGTELVMTIAQADQLGAIYPTRVLIYGPRDRAALHQSLTNRGLYANSKVRVRKSWDSADPDSTLSMAVTKSLLGEFDYDYAHLTTSGWTAMNAGWVAQYLPTRDTYPLGVRARCNVRIKADLTAALNEVANAGLGGGIDVANTNTYGGCGTGQVRFSRITQNLGSVSRHSWGQPIDMNTLSNCQGCVPVMDCRIVRIFRAHNFAWGGNFLTPDGMHFEWVGQPRNNVQYPSKYCPNLSNGRTQSTTDLPPPAPRELLFADDGWMGE